MFYPVSELLNPVAFEAPPSVPDDGVLPYIVLISTTEVRVFDFQVTLFHDPRLMVCAYLY